jgi:hypothetical protein
MPKEREREKMKKGRRKDTKRNTGIQGVLLLLPSQAMAEQDWTPSKVTQGHMQSLMKQGFKSVSELVACRVPQDAALPTLTERNVSHPVLRPKPDAHRMYAQDQVVIHTTRM